MAARAASGTRATVPRQPAWTVASTRATGSKRTSGTQSATRVTRTTAASAVTRASTPARASAAAVAPVPGLGPGDDGRRGPVHLGPDHEVVQGGPERRRRPAAVLQHRRGVVADVEAEVERVVGGGRDPARPGGDHDVDAEVAQRRPLEHLEVAVAPHPVPGRTSEMAARPPGGVHSPVARTAT